MNQLVLSLGSNIGVDDIALENNLRKAVFLLMEAEQFRLDAFSSLYKTSPREVIEQDYFLNQVITGETSLKVRDFLSLIQSIEKRMKSKKLFLKGPRIIDIDIIFFNDESIAEEDLIVPHPAFKERLFVLEPLLEINRNFIDPTTNKKIKDYLSADFKKDQKIERYLHKEKISYPK